MKLILVNVVYDEDEDESLPFGIDLICIPEFLQDSIRELAQQYLDWLPPESATGHWICIDGQMCNIKSAILFVKWLNQNVCTGLDKADFIEADATQKKGSISVDF